MTQTMLDENFDVEIITDIIESQLSQWRCHRITLNNIKWEIFDFDGNTVYSYFFNINFEDIEARIKLEDLRLNIIHYIESMKDDTTYDYYLNDLFR
ncbi:MAG: hypothetical protein Q4P18_04115 [Methanobrevibacter sp.]|uniref:hypothetical protein n=1 Tax=Methanobrevibacter sp. TaxID=66852 RepID=UPI0026E10B97|nr:hypothetical protein [Methanobrevibacter sp.]MDO5848696.1 hypothetical protein [Methanobrevibacter sp.]